MAAILVEESTETPILGLGLAGVSMTPEEFDAVEEFDEEYRYELIRGVLVVTAVPLVEESGPNELLGHRLFNYRERHPLGSSLDFTLMEQYVRVGDSRRRADRLIWTGLGRYPNVKRDLPTIAVEFISEGKRNRLRDYVEKKSEYLAIGIREYWVFDRFRKLLTVFRAGEAEIVVGAGGAYESPLLPGFQLTPGKLFDLADALGDAG